MNNDPASFIDFDHPAAAPVDSLTRIRGLGELLNTQIDEESRLTAELKAAKEARRRTEEEDLPQLMKEVGLTEIKLASGETVKIKEEVTCGITQANRDDALAWLIKNGFGGLIKTEIALAFGRGDRDLAERVAGELSQQGYQDLELKEVVHPGTLKSFIKERMAAGEAIPMDLFSVRPFDKATLTKGK